MTEAKDILVMLITDFRGLIPQRIQAWDGYDLDVIQTRLMQAGVDVRVLGAHEVTPASYAGVRHAAAVYASSQEPRYKQYLQAIVGNLAQAGVQLYPAFEHMLAHEDKAYQAVRMARTQIGAPRSFVFGYKPHAYQFVQRANYPLIAKTPYGYGSRGVQIIRDAAHGRAYIDRHMEHIALDKGRPKIKRALQRIFRPRPVLGLIVFQDYIPNLSGDWKILIWGNQACGVQRYNRPNDFRASGSGRLAFSDVPTPVLDFAYDAIAQLGLPWGSLDIGYDGEQSYLFEYQGLHFGLTTADKGRFFYVRHAEGNWEKHMGRIQIEIEMANVILRDMTQRGWLSTVVEAQPPGSGRA
jgi:glutathione synthase/RimK-type ligase-like ATP-grasp enzyme